MVNKYARHLEERDINVKTNEVWSINDVPNTWKNKTQIKVVNDGYYFDNDGTVYPNRESDIESEE